LGWSADILVRVITRGLENPRPNLKREAKRKMWHIQLKNGLAISQSQISNWNAIPPETQIEKAALIRERPDGTCYEFAEYRRYCIAGYSDRDLGLGPWDEPAVILKF
jgi:hypothetical protein